MAPPRQVKDQKDQIVSRWCSSVVDAVLGMRSCKATGARDHRSRAHRFVPAAGDEHPRAQLLYEEAVAHRRIMLRHHLHDSQTRTV